MSSLYLALLEMRRNKRRFAVLFLIIALITLLVLLTAGMGDGLALGAREYLEHTGADLIVFQNDVDFQIPASRLGHARLNAIRRVEGVAAVGPIGFSTASVVAVGEQAVKKIDVSLVGVEPNTPGSPPVLAGTELNDVRDADVVIDRYVLDQLHVPLGSTITLKVVQGTEEKLYPLTVVGYAEGNKSNYISSIFVPLRRWDRIKPQETPGGGGDDLVFNVAAVRLENPAARSAVAALIEQNVSHVAVTDPVTAYENTLGYRDMQATLNMQQSFVLLVVLLIIGSFFQIQTMQKAAQIGMLKAIGASSRVVIVALLVQVMLTTLVGLLLGGGIVWGIAQVLPTTIPIVFDGTKMALSIVSLLVAGPLAGSVAVRTVLKIEPLKALGLSA